ncbi:MAG: endonuclease domain-containing protein, partial [Bacteroidota bacterium]
RQLEGKKFRRQPSIGNYIVDFYCPEEQLVIELDGGLHDNPGQAATDRYRQAHLEDLGFTVLRFPNEDIFHAMDAVLNKIKAHWREAR